MGTDYSPTTPSRRELNARILIACRDHDLPDPASLSFIDAHLVSMFVDNEYHAQEWAAFLGGRIKRDFYGWTIHMLVRDFPVPMADVVRAVVDDAVSDYESTTEVFLAVSPGPLACKVPYLREMTCCDTISECVRPKGHLGDHADGNAHQWKNDYNDTDFRTVTP